MAKILVIEDEESIRENILDLLEAENFEGIGAINGQVGIKLANEQIPDLILCDMMMPEVDGHGVAVPVLGRDQAATQRWSQVSVAGLLAASTSWTRSSTRGALPGSSSKVTRVPSSPGSGIAIGATMRPAEAETIGLMAAAGGIGDIDTLTRLDAPARLRADGAGDRPGLHEMPFGKPGEVVGRRLVGRPAVIRRLRNCRHALLHQSHKKEIPEQRYERSVFSQSY